MLCYHYLRAKDNRSIKTYHGEWFFYEKSVTVLSEHELTILWRTCILGKNLYVLV